MNPKCKGCGAPIIWAKTIAGKSIPVDVDPSEGGNIELRSGVAIVLSKDQLRESSFIPQRYRPHFETCPKAAEYRKAK